MLGKEAKKKKKSPLNKYFPFSWYRDAIHPISPDNAFLENALADRWEGSAHLLHVTSRSQSLSPFLLRREGRDSMRDFPSGAQLVGSLGLTLLHKTWNPLAPHPPQCELGTLAHAPDLGHLGSNLTLWGGCFSLCSSLQAVSQAKSENLPFSWEPSGPAQCLPHPRESKLLVQEWVIPPPWVESRPLSNTESVTFTAYGFEHW